MPRLLYASDLHGSQAHYLKLLEFAREAKPGAILLGGDLFPDFPPVESDPARQREFVRKEFAAWCRSAPAPVFFIAGNHDWASSLSPIPALDASYVHGKCVPLGDWELLGFSLCSPTPYWIIDHERAEEAAGKREPKGRSYASENKIARPVDPTEWFAKHPTLAAELRALPAPKDWKRTVFMAHDPPFSSGLDTRHGGTPVGSADVRNFILERKPAISLHGHIHEAPILTGSFRHRVGDTWGFNAGRVGDRARALLLDPEKPEEATLLDVSAY